MTSLSDDCHAIGSPTVLATTVITGHAACEYGMKISRRASRVEAEMPDVLRDPDDRAPRVCRCAAPPIFSRRPIGLSPWFQ